MTGPYEWPSTRMTLLNRLRDMHGGEAWAEFYVIYSPLVYRFCRNRNLKHEDAEEVTHNSMISIQRSLRTFDSNKGKFRNWFFKVIRSGISRHCKAAGRMVSLDSITDDPPDQHDDEEVWDEEFNIYMLETAIERVRPQFNPLEWRVFEEAVLSGLKTGAVAIMLQQSAAWISRVKYKIVKRLKEEIRYLSNDDAQFGAE